MADLLDEEGNEFINCFVSFGSGTPEGKHKHYSKARSRAECEEVAGYDSNSTHDNARSTMSARDEKYFRFNFTSKQWHLPLDAFEEDHEHDFRHHRSLDAEIDATLEMEETKVMIDECAQRLVDQRRARALDEERLRRFDTASFYRCDGDQTEYNLPRDFRNHMQTRHRNEWKGKSQTEQDDHLRACRVDPPVPGVRSLSQLDLAHGHVLPHRTT